MPQNGGFRPFGARDTMARMRKYRSSPDEMANGPNRREVVCREHLLRHESQRRTTSENGSSPSIFRAKCASDAVSFLVLASADREFIVDIGEDGDVGVDPSRHAAAKLQHGGLA